MILALKNHRGFFMRNNFLNKLKIEEKLELVEPSENICESYLEKSEQRQHPHAYRAKQSC